MCCLDFVRKQIGGYVGMVAMDANESCTHLPQHNNYKLIILVYVVIFVVNKKEN